MDMHVSAIELSVINEYHDMTVKKITQGFRGIHSLSRNIVLQINVIRSVKLSITADFHFV